MSATKIKIMYTKTEVQLKTLKIEGTRICIKIGTGFSFMFFFFSFKDDRVVPLAMQ